MSHSTSDGVAVGRDLVGVPGVERRAEVLDRRERLDGVDDVVDDCAERRVVDRERLALDQHDLGLRVGLEAGVAQDRGRPGATGRRWRRSGRCSSCRRPCRSRRRRSRRRASRRLRSSSDSRSSDPSGPRCCWTSSGVTWLTSLSLCGFRIVCPSERLSGARRGDAAGWCLTVRVTELRDGEALRALGGVVAA